MWGGPEFTRSLSGGMKAPKVVGLALVENVRVPGGDCVIQACRAQHKHVLVASEEVNELAFLFGVQAGFDLHSFGRLSDIDLYGLDILARLENVRHRGHGRAGLRCRYLKVELP
jgi:hypothetical protein